MNVITTIFLSCVAGAVFTAAFATAEAMPCPTAADVQSAQFYDSPASNVQILKDVTQGYFALIEVSKNEIQHVQSKVTGAYQASASFNPNPYPGILPIQGYYTCTYKPYLENFNGGVEKRMVAWVDIIPNSSKVSAATNQNALMKLVGMIE